MDHEKVKKFLLMEDFKRYDNALRLLYEESRSLGMIIDTEGIIRDINKATINSLGYSRKEFIGRSILDFVVYSQKRLMEKQLEKEFKCEETPEREIDLYANDGSIRTILFHSRKIILYDKNKPSAVLLLGNDVTDQERAEETIKRERSFSSAILDTAGALIIVFDREGRILRFNRACSRTTNYSFEEVKGKHLWDFLLIDEEIDRIKKEFEMLASGLLIKRGESHLVTKLGEHRLVSWSNTVLLNESDIVEYIISIGIDITDQRKALDDLTQSEKKYRELVEKAGVAIVIFDRDCNIQYFNKHFTDLLGYEKSIMKKIKINNIIHADDLDKVKEYQYRRIHNKKPPSIYEFRAIRKDGSIIYLEAHDVNLKEYGRTVGIRSYIWDVTERKKIEEKIRNSLKEKDVLLREIHHRVKNNLQVIKSLLSLQSMHVKDKEALKVLEDSQNRVRTMALVHEKLYQSEDFSRIDLSEYSEGIARNLCRSNLIDQSRVEIDIDVGSVSIGVDQAVPCGLIINELVSNALKHAFPDSFKGKGKIRIALSRVKNKEVELIVQDNGVGLPGDIDIHNVDSLGLKLVSILAEDQLDGKLDIVRGKGTIFKIKFKLTK